MDYRNLISGAVICAAVFLLTGCGSRTNDASHNISGTVTFDGKPIPRGFIRFTPDESQGNKGATGYAEIIDGKFNTKTSKKSQGVEGGAYIVRIDAYDGNPYTSKSGNEYSLGKPLFAQYTVKKELPSETTTLQLEITSDDVELVDID